MIRKCDSFEHELKLARGRGYQSFIEIIDIADVVYDRGLQEGVQSYPKLEECFEDCECRAKIQMFKVPVRWNKKASEYFIEDTPDGIVCRRYKGKLYPIEGKHRLDMARKLGIKQVIARVAYWEDGAERDVQWIGGAD